MSSSSSLIFLNAPPPKIANKMKMCSFYENITSILNIRKYLTGHLKHVYLYLPEGGLGDAAFFVLFDPAAISDFAGHVGNILGSMAFGDSWKYSAMRA